METPLYTCMTKGSDREAGPPGPSANWVVSRRARFKIYDDRVEVGDWRIPFARVERAVCYRMPYLPLVDASVLELTADGRTYQFGFNPWAHPERHLPIPVEQRDEATGRARFGVLLRVVLFAYLAYLLWSTFAQR